MSARGLTAKELRTMSGLVDLERPYRPQDLMPQSSLQDIASLVPCDDISFVLIDTDHRWCDFQGFPDIPDDWDEETDWLSWEAYYESPAIHYPQQTGDHRSIVRLSDCHSRRDIQHMKLGAWMGRTHLRHFVSVPVPVLDAIDRRVVLFRWDGSDFTDREVQLLTLLRPLIVETHVRRFREMQGRPDLTPRQWEILRLLAIGLSNRQVGRRLGISGATVGKHLENAYARMGVNSRTEALARIRLSQQEAHTLAP